MKALTLRQPWADAVATGCKDVENRSWAPPSALLGADIGIHAGLRTVDEASYRALMGRKARSLEKMPRGAIVAIARLIGGVNVETGIVIGPLTHEQLARVLDSPWTTGPWGWLLDHVRAVEPVPCRGAQGLWDVPESVVRAMHELKKP